MKFELVLQGDCVPETKQIIEEYSRHSFVDRIILSTYENSLCFDVPDYVDVIFNEEISPRGTGNRNLQINTSRNGLSLVQATHCAKMRTDQYIRPHSMQMMYDYWNRKQKDQLIFVLGMYKAFPYHPRDHVFWGRTEDVKSVFDIPFDADAELNPQQDYRYKTRAETYIGQFYYARFDNSVYDHINDPMTYLVDEAPLKQVALEKDYKMRHKVFAPFPKVSMEWRRKGLHEYHYHVGEFFTEYWAND